MVVDADDNRLHLCSNGRSEGDYGVSLGRNGVGKTREGDARTPVGVFSLGEPRGSREFHLFIPVGYPTTEQRKAGFTGGAVGIHGPKRGWRWLGRLANVYNWTGGCIAVNREQDIEAIAAWVRLKRVTTVSIVSTDVTAGH